MGYNSSMIKICWPILQALAGFHISEDAKVVKPILAHHKVLIQHATHFNSRLRNPSSIENSPAPYRPRILTHLKSDNQKSAKIPCLSRFRLFWAIWGVLFSAL